MILQVLALLADGKPMPPVICEVPDIPRDTDRDVLVLVKIRENDVAELTVVAEDKV